MGINKLRAMEYLMASIDYGTFAAAARHLGVAAPSVHRLIGALEDELGTALLHRDGKALRPTRDAELYVERVRRLLSDFTDLESGLRDAQRLPTGTVVIASHSVVTRFLLTQALTSFHATFPNVLVDLRDPWVRIPGAFFTVADDTTTPLQVFVDAGSTIGQLVVTPNGQLQFVPVVRGKHWRDDD